MAEECRSDGYNIPRPEHTCTCTCTYDCFMSRLSKYLGHLGVWGELTSHKRLFNPPLQLGIYTCKCLFDLFFYSVFKFSFCVLYVYMADCMPLCVCVGMIVWAFFLPTILVCYAHACLSMYLHSGMHIL